MGVSNLLKELQPLVEKPTSAEATLQRFKGEKLAVDLSSWLYKGAARGRVVPYPSPT